MVLRGRPCSIQHHVQPKRLAHSTTTINTTSTTTAFEASRKALELNILLTFDYSIELGIRVIAHDFEYTTMLQFNQRFVYLISWE